MARPTVQLRSPRTWSVYPAAVAVVAFGLGYVVWLVVGLDAGLGCRDTTLSCGGGVWRGLIGVLYGVAAVFGAIAAAGFLWLVGHSLWTAFAKARS